MAVECIGFGAIDKLGEYLLVPIRHQLSYFFRFKRNINDLETQLENLETTRLDVLFRVDEERRNERPIPHAIQAWLNKATKVTTEAKRIIDDKKVVQQGCLKGWCPNLKLWYLSSRKAIKKTQEVKEHQADGRKYTESFYRPTPVGMLPLPSTDLAKAVVSTFVRECIGCKGIEKLEDYLRVSIERQLSYFFRFKRHVNDLETQLENQETTRLDLQFRVDDGRNVRTIPDAVQAWLNKATKVTTEAKRIIDDKKVVQQGCLKGWCPNLKLRYLLSRKAIKKTQEMKELQTQVEKPVFIKCAKPSGPFPVSMEPRPSTDFMNFKSRISTRGKIIEALKNDNIDLIGIIGMGGVGKTTMAEDVAKRAQEEKLFDEVVMTVVSQDQDLLKVQNSIAKQLGLELDNYELGPGSTWLRHRLQQNTKVLLILDDIWDKFDLKSLGIRFSKDEKSSCKVIFTSRNGGLWRGVKSKQDFSLGTLEEKEAWDLFIKKAGDFPEDPDMQQLAKDIVRECRGLPLALVIIGSTLLNKDQKVWRDALRQLQQPSPESFLSGRVLAKVYRSIKFSYNNIEGEDAKSLFLLCSLFEEDYHIPLEVLFRYGFGLELFQGINDLNEARDRLYILVKQLYGYNLLLRYEEDTVKMHDVVRDVAISIASGDEHGFLTSNDMEAIEGTLKNAQCRAFISIMEKSRNTLMLPEGLRYPKLKLLRFNCPNKVLLEAPDYFFQGITELKVLDLLTMRIPTLPSSLGFVTKLRTLCLEFCELENISVIGKLQNLEILGLQSASIVELPEEIGSLSNLRLLDLESCLSLERIAPGVISGLTQLRELHMRGSNFSAWEGEGREEGKNASLNELNSLTYLNILEIRIDDGVILPRFRQFSNLSKFTILLGTRTSWEYTHSFEKQLFLAADTWQSLSESGTGLLMKNNEYLDLSGDVSKYVWHELIDQCQELEGCLKLLRIHDSNTMECIANTGNSSVQHRSTTSVIFPSLDELDLHDLPNMRQVILGNRPLMKGSLEKLHKIFIWNCVQLTSLFHVSIVRALEQLESLEVLNCRALEEIIRKEEKKERGDVMFRNLKFLSLYDLPKLISFCKGLEEPEFPQLEEQQNIAFSALFPRQVAFSSLERITIMGVDNLQGIGIHDIVFPQVEKLRISFCERLVYVFSSQFLARLANLKVLQIERCDLLENIITQEFEEGSTDTNRNDGPLHNTLPKLKSLGFTYFPQLTHLHILCCPNLRYLFPFSLVRSIPQLQDLEINQCKKMTTIFFIEEINQDDENMVVKVNLPHLKRLQFDSMDSLVSFSTKVITPSSQNSTLTTSPELNIQKYVRQPLFDEKVEFLALEDLDLNMLPQMNQIWSSLPQVMSSLSFKLLNSLSIENCVNLPDVFSLPVAKYFEHLSRISICRCSTLKVVVAKEEDNSEEKEKEYNLGISIEKTPLLPKLKILKLAYLPALKSFCDDNHEELVFSLLESVIVRNCPQMETFSHGSLRTPKLMSVSLQDENDVDLLTEDDGLEMKDLNTAIPHAQKKIQIRGKKKKKNKGA